VSDSVINYFDVDRIVAREGAKKWWESEGNYAPDQTGPATDYLDSPTFQDVRNYAILEAGRERVKMSA